MCYSKHFLLKKIYINSCQLFEAEHFGDQCTLRVTTHLDDMNFLIYMIIFFHRIMVHIISGLQKANS